MRRWLLLLLLLPGTPAVHGQWQIFAEKLPPAGSWAHYRMETQRDGQVVAQSDVGFSVRPGRDMKGRPCVWFTVEPVAWLGSREQAPLHLLLHTDMDRGQASRLIENAEEIIFSNPVKGAYHMTREDISWISNWAKLSYTSELTPGNPARETVLIKGRKYDCERQNILAMTVTDPPLVTKQTIEMKGIVWRAADSPFGVVQAEWTEQTIKKDKTRTETKSMRLIEAGFLPPPQQDLERGREFSVWRLIFGR